MKPSLRFPFSSLRGRLLLSYIGLIIIGFGGLTLLAGQQLANSIIQDFADSLQRDALLIATTLVEPIEHFYEGEESLERLLGRVQQFANQTKARIVLLDPQGQPWLDTAGNMPTIAAVPPEITAVYTGSIIYDIRPNEAGVETMYTAAPIMEVSEFLGVVWLSAETVVVQTAVRQRWWSLGGFFLVFVSLGIMISLWLLGTLTKPLDRLRQTALKMAAGDLEQRVADLAQDEVGAVGVAFNQMAERVQRMVQEQAAFASNAAHELRTPLTTVRLRTEWLQSAALDDATARQYIGEIDGEIRRMAGLVDDLTLLSRLDAQRLAVGQEQVDVGRLAQALQRDLRERAAAKQIALTLSLPAPLPPLQANMNHVRVVLRNLLDNALKYTPEQGVVQWQLMAEGGELAVLVRDNGQGIAADDLPRVRGRFYRSDKARSRQVEGVGLGLSLVDSIVTLYNGRWQLESDGLGKGTTVRLWWPFVQAV